MTRAHNIEDRDFASLLSPSRDVLFDMTELPATLKGSFFFYKGEYGNGWLDSDDGLVMTIAYDGTSSGIAATNVKDAIDEVQASLSGVISGLTWKGSVVNVTTLTPPGGAASGDQYLINGIGLGGWAGKGFQLATSDGAGGWTYEDATVATAIGWAIWDRAVAGDGWVNSTPGAVWTKEFGREAAEIPYDNSTSGVAGTNVQDAVDAVDAIADTALANAATAAGKAVGAQNTADTHISDPTAAHAATAVSYDPTASGLGVTTAQAAIDAVDGIADGAVTDASTADGKAVAAQATADDALLFTRVEPLPAADQTSGGGTVIEWTNNTGSSILISKMVAISGSDSISMANANLGALVGPALGITLEAIADGATGSVLMSGIYRDDTAFAGLAAGDKLYLDETDGGIVNEANVPGDVGDVQQRVGVCTHANAAADGKYVIYLWPAILEIVKT